MVIFLKFRRPYTTESMQILLSSLRSYICTTLAVDQSTAFSLSLCLAEIWLAQCGRSMKSEILPKFKVKTQCGTNTTASE